MEPEGATLSHQSIQQQGRLLRKAIVFDEKLLELIYQQEDARHTRARLGTAILRNILHTGSAKDVLSALQFDI